MVIPEVLRRPNSELVGVAVNELPPGSATALDLSLIPGAGTIR